MPPLARTHEEAHLYMDLRACGCGGPDASRDSTLRQVEGVWHVVYSCVCAGCGTTRTFEFRQPNELVPPADGEWSVGERPSELLDAGEWLLVADLLADVPAEPAGMSAGEVDEARASLAAAAAAVGEALKFLPEAADEVPDTALWTDRGRSLRAGRPLRFQRHRLEAEQDTYRMVRAGLVAAPEGR